MQELLDIKENLYLDKLRKLNKGKKRIGIDKFIELNMDRRKLKKNVKLFQLEVDNPERISGAQTPNTLKKRNEILDTLR